MNFQEYRDTVLKTGIDDYAALLNIGRKWEKIGQQTSKYKNRDSWKRKYTVNHFCDKSIAYPV